ncbi:serine protease inhibitor 42Dd [Drosophila mojavensis]|uniref:Serpin domain-containing protein n=1 Tax=Drosophila mojavensis TaxID=7230 RepID=B4KZP8_DROMO|nr:serine protease inhibitor 42Dd [Drosophila mojavensis]EDW19004.1 uncharacterized protein Dmoj_GI11773 [Drosophila mojavensis]
MNYRYKTYKRPTGVSVKSVQISPFKMTKLSCSPVFVLLCLSCVVQWTFANDIAMKLLGRTLEWTLQPNIVVSPKLLIDGLFQLFLGAAGHTQEELGVLLFENTTENELDQFVPLNNTDESESAKLYKANTLFAADSIKILDEYQAALRQIFNSEVQSVDFKNPETVHNINRWVAEKTNDKIQSFLSGVDVNTQLLLISAIYFKGFWRHPFNPSLTKQKPFYTPSSEVLVDTMVNDGYYNYKYVEILDADALEIPYMNSKISMLILLPRTPNGFEGIQNKLHKVTLKDISPTESRAFHVELPKFNLDFQTSFTNIFKSVGIVDIFQNSANFSSISQTPIMVSEIFQKATIEVRENGTEASASQGTILVPISAIVPVIYTDFLINRPFIFLIKDNTNAYFAGRVVIL